MKCVHKILFYTMDCFRDYSEDSSDSCDDEEMSETYCTSDEEEQEDPKDYHKGQFR